MAKQDSNKKKNVYGPITFADGYNKDFASFKKEFSGLELFKNMVPKVREAEMKKAHKIATNGNISTSKTKSGKSDTKEDK